MRLLRAALQLGRLPAHEAARASFDLETLTRAWSGASTIRRFARVAEDLADRGDGRGALEALGTVAVRSYWDQLDDKTRRHVSAIVEGLAVPADDPERLAALALIDPVHRGPEVIDRIGQMSPDDMPGPEQSMAVGRAAMAVWADNLAVPFLSNAVAGFRLDGRLAQLTQCLSFEAWANINCGSVRAAITGAAESARLAEETRQFRYVLAAKLAHAIAAAELGEEENGRSADRRRRGGALADGHKSLSSGWSRSRAAERLSQQTAQARRTIISSASSIPRMCAISPTHAAGHSPTWWTRLSAATATSTLVQRLLGEWESDGGRDELAASRGPAGLRGGDACRHRDGRAGVRDRDRRRAPRVGRSIRPARSSPTESGCAGNGADADSRTPLREAARIFDALGLRRFAERARSELRASGERARRRVPEAWTELSPQELQIAQLAAEGLSNREIGERLYLSHRTVGTHLYRLFPKLGITSRTQLRDALAPPHGS